MSAALVQRLADLAGQVADLKASGQVRPEGAQRVAAIEVTIGQCADLAAADAPAPAAPVDVAIGELRETVATLAGQVDIVSEKLDVIGETVSDLAGATPADHPAGA